MLMNDNKPPWQAWRASRFAFALFHFAGLLVLWLVLRTVLFFQFMPADTTPAQTAAVFGTGFYRDILVALLLTLPLFAWFLILPEGKFGSPWHRRLFFGLGFLFWFVTVFLLFVEYFFFEEFRSRFNTVAVDYLIYPQEVFVNIWESYHVGVVVAVCLAIASIWLLATRKLFGQMWVTPLKPKRKVLAFVAVSGLALVLLPTINLKGTRATVDRTLNEVANNGDLSFVAAAYTRHLEYSAYYKTLAPNEAYARARHLLTEPNSSFLASGESIRRRIAGDPSRPRLNVVVVLEESLGSKFWGCLGRVETLTPEMDKLATSEGLLFTNLYACGNRTVRGMEGVLSSFPPLPGDSIVKRDLSDNVETLARVFKRDGYSTTFLYGGRGLFDGMRSYAVRNGYDRFIEQKNFTNPTFTTAWGVCDEDLFDRTIAELSELAKSNQPFFATVLTVSNHKPYTYPKGRIPEDPEEHKRNNAVKYSDYALGRFFREARKQSFWTNTIFAVVADHGDRVYGSQSIPIKSYEIPLVILGPAVVSAPRRIPQLGSSLDVGPTILGQIGRPYESMFFGRDILTDQASEGRALLNHNRDIGMLAQDRLVVLGLMKNVEFYQGDPRISEVTPLSNPSEKDLELEKNVTALFQVADDLYTHQQYRVDSGGRTDKQSKSVAVSSGSR